MPDKRPDRLTARQAAALTFVSMLSPLIRQMPGHALASAGHAVWLSALLAVPLVLLYGALLERLLPAGRGIAEALTEGLGALGGRAAVFVFSLWLGVYAGFVLRAGADRFVGAVYPGSPVWLFAAVTLALALLGASGRVLTLARFSELVIPLLGGVFLLVFAFALPQLEPENLFPVSRADIGGAVRGALPLADTLSLSAVFLFLRDRTEPEGAARTRVRAILWLSLLGFLLCVYTVGAFGAELASELNHPFFVLIREIRVFELLERIEALVIAQWVIADFVLLGALFRITADSVSLSLWGDKSARPRLSLALTALFAAVSAALCAPGAFALRRFGAEIMPRVNAVMLFAALPLLLWIAKLRHINTNRRA